MAYRRYLSPLTCHTSSLIFSNPHSLQPLKILIPRLPPLQNLPHILHPKFESPLLPSRSFSSRPKNPKTLQSIDQEQEDDGEEEDETSDEESESANAPSSHVSRAYSVEDKIAEVANIGYKVIGPIRPDDRVSKPYEPIFAVI